MKLPPLRRPRIPRARPAQTDAPSAETVQWRIELTPSRLAAEHPDPPAGGVSFGDVAMLVLFVLLVGTPVFGLAAIVYAVEEAYDLIGSLLFHEAYTPWLHFAWPDAWAWPLWITAALALPLWFAILYVSSPVSYCFDVRAARLTVVDSRSVEARRTRGFAFAAVQRVKAEARGETWALEAQVRDAGGTERSLTLCVDQDAVMARVQLNWVAEHLPGTEVDFQALPPLS